jgi:hypothetical protein
MAHEYCSLSLRAGRVSTKLRFTNIKLALYVDERAFGKSGEEFVCCTR